MCVCHAGAADLDGTISSNQLILEVWGPQSKAGEVHEQVLVHNCELATQHSPHVDVAGVWLKALVVAQDLNGIISESANSLSAAMHVNSGEQGEEARPFCGE